MKKYGRPLAVILCVIMALSALAAVTDGFGIQKVNATDLKQSDEKRIASEISNITGVDIERVIELRNESKSWNEVLEKLKEQQEKGEGQNRKERNELLSSTTIGEDFLEKLEKEGFSKDEILEARLLAERIAFQLQEITTGRLEAISTASNINETNRDTDDEAVFRELAEKFDVKVCIYLALKLRKDFGDIEAVVNEYLFALQIGVNLEEYLFNREEYEKQRKEKSVGVDSRQIITITKIEEKMLLRIKEENTQSMPVVSPKNKQNQIDNDTDAKVQIPEIPLPKAPDVIPKNPAEEIMNEINVLDPMKN